MPIQPDPDDFRLPPSGNIPLSSDEIHVWRINYENAHRNLARHSQIISPEEKFRADKFHFEKDKNFYILRHGILRCILGRYLFREPGSIQFEFNTYGKPTLKGSLNNAGIQFNLSHSNDLALIVITADKKIGIDIEYINANIDYNDIAIQYFSENETAELRTLPPSLQLLAFYTCWTRKEAYIKALGNGLTIPLNKFDVSLIPGESAALLRTSYQPPPSGLYLMHEIRPHRDYIGAVVVNGKKSEVKCWGWME